MTKDIKRLLWVCWCCLLGNFSQASSTVDGADGKITITPLVHSSVQLEYQDLVIQVDPWSAISINNYKSADIILVTDNPGHHLDVKAIRALSNPAATVIAPANSAEVLADAVIMANGETLRVQGIEIEAIAAYDIILGPPEHPKGDANGYVVTIGGKRILFAGVTECVEEIRSLPNIDVAFMPLNIPPARMTPEDAAACVRHINPAVVFTNHYDQNYARRVNNPNSEERPLPGGGTVAHSLEAFSEALDGSGIEYIQAQWYPPRFELDKNFPSLPLGQRWLTGGLGGMCIGSDDKIVLLNRQNVVADDLDGALLHPRSSCSIKMGTRSAVGATLLTLAAGCMIAMLMQTTPCGLFPLPLVIYSAGPLLVSYWHKLVRAIALIPATAAAMANLSILILHSSSCLPQLMLMKALVRSM